MLLSHRLFIRCLCTFRFSAVQTISSSKTKQHPENGCCCLEPGTRVGLIGLAPHPLVVAPSALLIAIRAAWLMVAKC